VIGASGVLLDKPDERLQPRDGPFGLTLLEIRGWLEWGNSGGRSRHCHQAAQRRKRPAGCDGLGQADSRGREIASRNFDYAA